MSSTPTLVREVMASEPFTLGRNDRLSVADDLMTQRRIRHIPVLDGDGLLAGVVTQRDLFRGALLRALGYGSRAEQKMLDSIVVKEAMTDEVVTTTPDTPLAEAAALMVERGVGCLPVLEGERLVGIVTEGTFTRLAAQAG